ncbi:YidC/Oxa1 family membrane protein insertase [Clostridiaceae bacterium NSJ-31]|uniref:YidC/Oxa1 family membrane protein insertase n=1 Tax=Ligaoa zhengdingensis TaxID=2763658 RepID=A0A926DXW5_9FIRM|nr:YidC/Oxa1 family membrane protein insertase [Ligaoa zhengdingensis]MBC8546826.1 YidC/Oxa1 family membrane protein insertase [Ligaoa zhengdingensis]
MMNFIYTIIGYPLGWVMWACYQLVHNYGFALILFTLISKLILLPFGIKQQKSTVKMAMFRPKMEAIQKKYANNPQKQQEELSALYEKEGYNPMSGCLPLLIQFPILFGLIDVIYKPLYHILRFPSDVIEKAVEIGKQVITANGTLGNFIQQNGGLRQENIIMKGLELDPSAFSTALGQDFVDKVASFDQHFLGLDLSQVPSLGFNLLILIPIISGLTSLLLSWYTTRMSAANMGNNASLKGMNMGMMLMMPIMSFVIALQVPAGVGLYWILTNLFSMAQSIFLNKKYNPAELLAAAQAEEEARKERERQERIERKKLMASKEYQQAEAEKAMNQKEQNRRKIAEARRRMAERYGEDYKEEDIDVDEK